MNRSQVIEKLQGIFDTLFLDAVVLSPELSAKDVPEWDSLMQISLVVSVEKAFNVKFRVGEIEKTKNIGEFADVILSRMAA